MKHLGRHVGPRVILEHRNALFSFACDTHTSISFCPWRGFARRRRGYSDQGHSFLTQYTGRRNSLARRA